MRNLIRASFVFDNDVKRRGVCMVSSHNINDRYKFIIEASYASISMEDKSQMAIGVDRISESEYVITSTVNVPGGEGDAREHNVIRGIVADSDALDWFFNSEMNIDKLYELFFPEPISFKSHDKWVKAICEYKFDEKNINLPVNNIKATEMFSLCSYLENIEKEKKRTILLQCPKENEFTVFSTIINMMKIIGSNAFVLLNGESNNKKANLVINNSSSHKMGSRSIELEEIFNMPVRTFEKKTNSGEVKMCIHKCMEYLKGANSTDDVIKMFNRLKLESPDVFRFVVFELKDYLRQCNFNGVDKRRFTILLMIVYKDYDSITVENEYAPYDFRGIADFISKTSINKEEEKVKLEEVFKLMIPFDYGDLEKNVVECLIAKILRFRK